jgi:5-methylcytosine-specific restriction enzyme A
MSRAAVICSALRCTNTYPCPSHDRSHGRGWTWSTHTVPAVLARDGHRCQQCGKPCPHPRHHDVDHVLPRAEGGSDDLSNLRTLCAAANRGSGRCRG